MESRTPSNSLAAKRIVRYALDTWRPGVRYLYSARVPITASVKADWTSSMCGLSPKGLPTCASNPKLFSGLKEQRCTVTLSTRDRATARLATMILLVGERQYELGPHWYTDEQERQPS